MRLRSWQVPALLIGIALLATTAGRPQQRSLTLQPCQDESAAYAARCGSYEVFEDRDARRGRVLSLAVVVLPALAARPLEDPILYLAGGPGGSATVRAETYADSWMRQDRDIVLVDQRGTGRSNPLPCALPGSAADLQGYLEGDFASTAVYKRCRKQLRKIANLKLYTTPIAVDDLDDVRAALGYSQVNLVGNSWGTRTGLIYLRRHPGSVRSAVLNSLAPLAVTYPLYHAAGAQGAVDTVLAECSADAACAAAFPNLRGELEGLFAELDPGPRDVVVLHPDTGEPTTVSFSREALADGIRYLMASVGLSRWLPAYVHAAWEGNYQPLVELTIDLKIGYRALKVGQLLSVVCPEDVARIDPADIPRLTANTFFGDTRVRQTLAVCRLWPKARMAAGYGDPVESSAPILIWGGTHDSFSRPEWVAAAAQYLPNSEVVIVPGAHSPDGDCIARITARFLERASVAALNTACVQRIELPPFQIPG